MRDYQIRKDYVGNPGCVCQRKHETRASGNANITFKYIEGGSILLLLDSKGHIGFNRIGLLVQIA